MESQAITEPPAVGVHYELYEAPLAAGEAVTVEHLHWKPSQGRTLQRSLTVRAGQGTIWARAGGPGLATVDRPDRATFGLETVQRRFSARLALIALEDGVFVNGAAALPLTILGPKDCIFLEKGGLLLYVTERFRPFVGQPTEESGLLGRECPACAVEIQAEPPTHVVSCRCGAVYHDETEQSHPDLPAEERLNCFQKTRVCLSCGHDLTTEEKLVWDPATL